MWVTLKIKLFKLFVFEKLFCRYSELRHMVTLALLPLEKCIFRRVIFPSSQYVNLSFMPNIFTYLCSLNHSLELKRESEKSLS